MTTANDKSQSGAMRRTGSTRRAVRGSDPSVSESPGVISRRRFHRPIPCLGLPDAGRLEEAIGHFELSSKRSRPGKSSPGSASTSSSASSRTTACSTGWSTSANGSWLFSRRFRSLRGAGGRLPQGGSSPGRGEGAGKNDGGGTEAPPFCLPRQRPPGPLRVGPCRAALPAGRLPGADKTGVFYGRMPTFFWNGTSPSGLLNPTKVHRFRPEDPLYRCGRGDILLRLDRLEEALEAYDLAVSLNPEQTGAYLNRLGHSLPAQPAREAADAFRKASAAEPDILSTPPSSRMPPGHGEGGGGKGHPPQGRDVEIGRSRSEIDRNPNAATKIKMQPVSSFPCSRRI